MGRYKGGPTRCPRRLRGAVQHNCRLCKSLREGNALDAGGSELLYADIERYETSDLLAERLKAALRYVDALLWKPSRIEAEVNAEVREHFTEEDAVEMRLDVMRNASNKIAVSPAADAPRVSEGTERYLIDAGGRRCSPVRRPAQKPKCGLARR